jgi:hypothetical protein
VAFKPPVALKMNFLDGVLPWNLPMPDRSPTLEPCSPGLYWIVIPDNGNERASPTSKGKEKKIKPTNRQKM